MCAATQWHRLIWHPSSGEMMRHSSKWLTDSVRFEKYLSYSEFWCDPDYLVCALNIKLPSLIKKNYMMVFNETCRDCL